MNSQDIEHTCAAAIKRLVSAGIDNPELDVLQLRKHYLTLSHSDLYKFNDAVSQREERVPLGYILGSAKFDSASFLVGKGTFIPREQSLPLLNDIILRANTLCVPKITDICAGVGPLGISLARRLSSPEVVFVEYNGVAISYLEKNVYNLLPEECKSIVIQKDIYSSDEFIEPAKRSDIVVANPPFVPLGRASLPEFSVHHPKDAIFSGEDGKDAVRRCCFLADIALNVNGIIGVEHHESHVEFIGKLLSELGFIHIRQIVDGDGKLRITTAIKSD